MCETVSSFDIIYIFLINLDARKAKNPKTNPEINNKDYNSDRYLLVTLSFVSLVASAICFFVKFLKKAPTKASHNRFH
jgi:hypothetical protein